MSIATAGLHHVTAIAGDPQKNIDFYITGLGLRLIKKTVNFDDPGTYHLYYGDESGTPGSLLTFFPWRGISSGRIGAGQSTTTAFSVPQGSIGWWADHFAALGVSSTVTSTSSDEERLSLRDPDGLQLDLVASSVSDPRDPWDSASVPAEYAVRGQHSSILTVRDASATVATLTEHLGMHVISETPDRIRVGAGDGAPGNVVDVISEPSSAPGLTAGGSVHHIAFRVADQATQQLWRDELAERGYGVTEILDRQYFTSIYFREPGGVLFEIATDTPGFDIDEPLLELGRSLKLPPWLEPSREAIEQRVVPVTIPAENNRASPHERRLAAPLHPGASDRPVLLTLHGTGSNEHDIAQIAGVIDPSAAVLSPRGKVSEHGMLRWFARRGEGLFDVDDVVFRSNELVSFVEWARGEYELGDRPIVAVGLSNGANIALAVALLHPTVLDRVIAFSGMYPLGDRLPESAGPADVAGSAGVVAADSLATVDVILLNGSADPMAPAASVDVLERVLRERGARVERATRPGGHGITQADVDAVRAWL